MWLLTVLILTCSCSQSTGTIDSMEPQKCVNTTKIDHLECLVNRQVTNIKELLLLFKESTQHIVNMRQEMEHRFDLQEKTLERLLEVHNSSLMPSNSTHSCPASVGTGVQANPSAAHNTRPIKSCRDLPRTDQTLLQLRDKSTPFWVLCVQHHESEGSGWVVIQQRVIGKVNFFRSWINYREGFGSLDDEFWLGLENIHRITRLQHYELLVEMVDYQGNYKFARYSRFELGGENEQYALRHLGSYSGTAGDSLRGHVGMKFSTYDNDNDEHHMKNCALMYSSGWWFKKCFMSNLNGLAVKKDNDYSINWYGFSSKWHSLRYTRMMLRMIP